MCFISTNDFKFAFNCDIYITEDVKNAFRGIDGGHSIFFNIVASKIVKIAGWSMTAAFLVHFKINSNTILKWWK